MAGEGGAVDFAQGEEPLAVTLPEVTKDRLVGVHAEELDGQDLRVGELRDRTVLSNTPSFELIVNQAEDGDDEVAKTQGKTSVTSRAIG